MAVAELRIFSKSGWNEATREIPARAQISTGALVRHGRPRLRHRVTEDWMDIKSSITKLNCADPGDEDSL